MAQETHTGALYQPRGAGWGGRWEGGSQQRGYCIGFAIYQHESATGILLFPMLNPPPSPYHPSGSSQCTSPKRPFCLEQLSYFSETQLVFMFLDCFP